MTTAGQFSSKNPTIKRILKEAAELASNPSADFHAAPLEQDLFEWHFTLRGPPCPSPFDGGVYHGRIVLPPAYPLKPPSFKFLTATGRFEVNREICLSISGHHEETWQPAWGIRTALVAIRSFMDTDASGQLGGMDASEEVRRRMAVQSKTSRCSTCGRSNEDIMREHDDTVRDADDGEKKAEDIVPEELRLAYREDVGAAKASKATEPTPATILSSGVVPQESRIADEAAQAPNIPSQPPNQSNIPVSVGQQVIPGQPPAHPLHMDDGLPEWVDRAIWGIILALIFLLWKKFIL